MANIEKNSPKAKKLGHIEKKKILKSLYEFRYNVVSHAIEARAVNSNDWSYVDENSILDEFTTIAEERGYIAVSKEKLLNTIGSRHVSPHYNPIETYLKALPDPTLADPVSTWCSNIELENTNDNPRQVLAWKKWYVGSIKTVLTNYVHKQCIVLVGKQAIGKTPFAMSIIPPELQENYIKIVQTFDLTHKDAMQTATRYHVGVIDELDGFFKRKVNRDNYKAFMALTKVNDRLPYGKTDICRKRICSFVATCNETTFLDDPTGTSRFSVFHIKGFKNAKNGYKGKDGIEYFMKKNIRQCWAWAYRRYLEGYDPEYTQEELELNEQMNELYKHNSPEFDIVQEYIREGEKGDEFMNTTQLCGYLNSKQTQIIFTNTRLGRALTRLGFKRIALKREGRCIKGYYVKFI